MALRVVHSTTARVMSTRPRPRVANSSVVPSWRSIRQGYRNLRQPTTERECPPIGRSRAGKLFRVSSLLGTGHPHRLPVFGKDARDVSQRQGLAHGVSSIGGGAADSRIADENRGANRRNEVHRVEGDEHKAPIVAGGALFLECVLADEARLVELDRPPRPASSGVVVSLASSPNSSISSPGAAFGARPGRRGERRALHLPRKRGPTRAPRTRPDRRARSRARRNSPCAQQRIRDIGDLVSVNE